MTSYVRISYRRPDGDMDEMTTHPDNAAEAEFFLLKLGREIVSREPVEVITADPAPAPGPACQICGSHGHKSADC